MFWEKMFNSIRLKLTLWYVGILALVLIAFAGLTYFLVVRVLAQEEDENLAEMVLNFNIALEAEQSDEQDKASFEDNIREAISESNFHDFNFIVYDGGNRLVASTTVEPKATSGLIDQIKVSKNYSTVVIDHEDFRVHVVPLKAITDNYRLFILHSLEDQDKFLSRLRSVFFAVVPLALFLTGLGGYFLARKSLAPVAEMSRRAAGISAANLNERLPVINQKDELGNLAQTFNNLLFRLESSFEQQRRFMADASHELRTPLAIVRGESEVSLARDNRLAAEYRESLAIVNDESKRLTHIVEDLFTLARADAGEFQINFAEIYLDEILAECVRTVRILAEERNITLNLTISQEMPMFGDDQLLRRLLINLLDNAIKYNRNSGAVTISVKKDEKSHRLTISDSGTGISKDEQTKVFERFYRADKARSRNVETTTSGAGLGLSIALWIAELHHGTIEIISSDQHGSVFEINLPFNNSKS